MAMLEEFQQAIIEGARRRQFETIHRPDTHEVKQSVYSGTLPR